MDTSNIGSISAFTGSLLKNDIDRGFNFGKFSSVNRIAGQCCVGRQKHFQPRAVFAGLVGGVHGSEDVAASKLSFGPFPVGWGVKSGACERIWRTSVTINRPLDKTGGHKAGQ